MTTRPFIGGFKNLAALLERSLVVLLESCLSSDRAQHTTALLECWLRAYGRTLKEKCPFLPTVFSEVKPCSRARAPQPLKVRTTQDNSEPLAPCSVNSVSLFLRFRTNSLTLAIQCWLLNKSHTLSSLTQLFLPVCMGSGALIKKRSLHAYLL